MRDRVVAPTATTERMSLGVLFWTFLKIGSVAFGGFMALISVVADTIVEKRQLLKQEDMLDCISLANLLPGPQGVNCVAYVGYRLRGGLGALVSAVGVLLPTFVLMLVLTGLYVAYASNADFRTIALFATDARLVTATNPARLAAMSDSDALRGQEHRSAPLLFLDADDHASMVLSGPVYLENTLLGQLVIEMDTSRLVEAVSAYAGLGDTGETVLAQRDAAGNARFLTPTRFDAHAAPHRTVSQDDLANVTIQAFQSTEQRTVSAVDYRGVPILAATAYLPVPGGHPQPGRPSAR
jgi:hypothetical protein